MRCRLATQQEGKWAVDWVMQPDLLWEAGTRRVMVHRVEDPRRPRHVIMTTANVILKSERIRLMIQIIVILEILISCIPRSEVIWLA